MIATGRRISAALGSPVLALRPVAGGDVCEAYRGELADGRTVFVKTLPGAKPGHGMFALESASLTWLAVPGGVSVPRPLWHDDATLVMQWVERGDGPRDEAGFGGALARLHAAGAPRWGWDHPSNLATLPLPNDPTATWAEFYGHRRIVPLVETCVRAGVLPGDARSQAAALCERLVDLVGPEEPPARLHGDLWGGNVLWDATGTAWLVDPAAYGGHREVDLAMLRLFGSPGPAFWEAYAAVRPLADGWADRVELYQLLPLLVHARLFGGGYVRSAAALLDRYAGRRG